MNDEIQCELMDTCGGGRPLPILALLTALAMIVGQTNKAAANFVIETESSWNGSSGIQPFGETNTATYGQTFTLNQNRVLQNFTFFVDDFLNPDVVDFEGFVMAWDGTKAAGPILFQSAPRSTTNNGGANGYEEITINTGGLALTGAGGGTEYVAFFSASNLFDGTQGTSRWGFLGNPYSEGNFVYQNNGSTFSTLTQNTWSNEGSGDLAFRLEFGASAVPEPSSLALLGTGIAGLLGFGWRRRRQQRCAA